MQTSEDALIVRAQPQWFGFTSRELLLLLVTASCLFAVVIRSDWFPKNVPAHLQADPLIRQAGERLGATNVSILKGGVRSIAIDRRTEQLLCTVTLPPDRTEQFGEELRKVVKETLANEGAKISGEAPHDGDSNSTATESFHFDYVIGDILGTVLVQCELRDVQTEPITRVSFAVVETRR